MLRYGVVYYSILKVSEARGRRSYELHCSQYKIQRKMASPHTRPCRFVDVVDFVLFKAQEMIFVLVLVSEAE